MSSTTTPLHLSDYESKVLADINAGKHSELPRLHAAVLEDCASLVTHFIESGDDPNGLDRHGHTPLTLLIRDGPRNKHVFSALVSGGASIRLVQTRRGHTALSAAMDDNCDISWVRMYLEAGERVDSFGWTTDIPMARACFTANWSVANLLIEFGAEYKLTQQHTNICGSSFEYAIINMIKNFGWPRHQDTAVWQKAFEEGDIKFKSIVLLWLAGVDLKPAAIGLTNARAGRGVRSSFWREERPFALHCLIEEDFSKAMWKEIRAKALDVIKIRAFDICIALQELNLPALMTQTILEEAIGMPWPKIPDVVYWDLVVAVKHFHDDKPIQPTKRRRF